MEFLTKLKSDVTYVRAYQTAALCQFPKTKENLVLPQEFIKANDRRTLI